MGTQFRRLRLSARKRGQDFFGLWNERFHAIFGYQLDQPALVEAYYLSKVRMYPLSTKWNNGDRWADSIDKRDHWWLVWHYKFRPDRHALICELCPVRR